MKVTRLKVIWWRLVRVDLTMVLVPSLDPEQVSWCSREVLVYPWLVEKNQEQIVWLLILLFHNLPLHDLLLNQLILLFL